MDKVVLALVRISPERVAALSAAGYTVREAAKYPSRIDALRAVGDSVSVIVTNGRGGLTGAEMEMLPKLGIICAISAGYEAVDVVAAEKRGIALTHSPGTNAPAVADSAMMLLLATTRKVLQANLFVRSGGWQEQWRGDTPIIFGKRLGILGLGTIGSSIAHRASRGFDMEIGYHNRQAVAASSYRYFEHLIELATWADFLIASTPGGAATRHLINADVLTALGPQGYVVNVGRGTVIDTAALIDALQAKRIGGAGLDVIEGEPSVPPRLPELLAFDNVVVTPHCAGRAPESQTAATALLLANLSAHFSGKPLITPITKKG